jgi:Leucine-rich repeat (LRR) protein
MMSQNRLSVFLFGCRESAATVDAPAAIPALSGDATVLLALDAYEPMYLLDANGRVSRLRLPNRPLPTAVMTEIGKLSELKSLDLFGAGITDEGLAELKGLQNLVNLGIGGTLITDKGLMHLVKLKSLRHTWLPNKMLVTEAGVEKLKQECPALTVH